MKIFRLILASYLLGAVPVMAEEITEGDELFLIALRTSMVGELFHRPLFQKEPISETLKKPYSVGTATMSGVATAATLDSFEAIALNLILDSTTCIQTNNTTDGAKDPSDPKKGKSHPEIGINFNSTIQTHARTTKTVLLQESGFSLFQAATAASSQLLGTDGLKVQTQGLLPGRRFEFSPGDRRPHRVYDDAPQLPIAGAKGLPRLKARMAPGQVQQAINEERAATEAKANQSITEKINENFNKTTWDELLPINYKYHSYVYEPLVLKQLLGGRLGLGSNNGWIALRGSKGDKAYLTDVSKIPNLPVTTDEPVLARLHAEFLERVAELRLGGTRLTEVEAAEMMGREGADKETLQNILGDGNEEVLFVYEEKKPIRVELNDNKITLTLRMSEATTLGQTLKQIQIRRTILISNTPEGLFLESQEPEAVTFYDGKPVPGQIGQHIRRRFGNSFAREKNNLRGREIFSSVKALAVRSLKTADNRIYVGLAPVVEKAGQK